MKEEPRKLNLQVSDNKAVLRERLRSVTRKVKSPVKKGNVGKSKSGEGSEEDDEENNEKNCEEYGSVNSSSDSERNSQNNAIAREMATRLLLSFKDIEEHRCKHLAVTGSRMSESRRV